MRVFVASGEVSGDMAGAELARALRARLSGVELVALGGNHMREAGVEVIVDTNHLGTVGVSEAVRTVLPLMRAFSAVRRQISQKRPDVAVLIGNDVFSVLLGRWLRACRVPTVSLFPPQAWIWGALAPLIARSYNLILTSFPDEHAVYERARDAAGCRVEFIGHWLAHRLAQCGPEERAVARRRLRLAADARVVAVFPGSRPNEVGSLLGLMLDAMTGALDRYPECRFVLAIADERLRDEMHRRLRERQLAARATLTQASHDALRAADVALLASGTASLEAALLGVPMVVVYRVSAWTNAVVQTAIALGLMPGDTVALPNLLLSTQAVVELKQHTATARNAVEEVTRLLDDPRERSRQRQRLEEVRRVVTCGDSSGRAAEAVVSAASNGADP
jgi:lipid-A-disaccharide synthase